MLYQLSYASETLLVSLTDLSYRLVAAAYWSKQGGQDKNERLAQTAIDVQASPRKNRGPTGQSERDACPQPRLSRPISQIPAFKRQFSAGLH